MKITRMICVFAAIALLGGCAGAPTVGDLDQRIVEKKAEIQQLAQQLAAETPPIFRPTHDIHAELKYRPLQEWLSEVSTPALVINVIGVRSSGDIVYQPGTGKAWIDPVRDTKMNLTIRPIHLFARPGELMWSTMASAGAETRIRFSILGAGGNFFCRGVVAPAKTDGQMLLHPMQDMTLPYSMRISVPGNLKVQLACPLGQLGTYRLSIPIGKIAQEVSNGEIDLGLETFGTVFLPKEGGVTPYRFHLLTVSPSITGSNDSLFFNTNVEVKTEK